MSSNLSMGWVAVSVILGLAWCGCRKEGPQPAPIETPANTAAAHNSEPPSPSAPAQPVKPAPDPAALPVADAPSSPQAVDPDNERADGIESGAVQSPSSIDKGSATDQPVNSAPDVVDSETTIMEELNKTGGLRLRRQVKAGADGTPINHGKVLEYTETGELWKESHWVDGVKHGAYIEWYKNGNFAQLGEFDHGKMVKVWTWFYPDGQKQREGSFDADNERHGTWTYWDREGNKTREEVWVNGVKKR